MLVFVLATSSAACSDALERDTTAGLAVAVANAGSNSVSLVDATSFAVSAPVDLGAPAGTPATMAARSGVVLLPLGPADAVKVLDSLGARRLVPLAVNSGATGVAVEDASLAWVANPNLGTATHFNYRTADTLGSIAVGAYPRAIALAGGTVFVVNSNAPGAAPVGPSWVTAVSAGGADSIPLTGANARFATLGDDGVLYVVASGTPGAADGRLSLVHPATRREVVVVNGLGESPGPAVYHPSGRLLIASRTEGVLEVNTLTRTLVRGPGAGVKPAGDGIAALAVDPRGRVYALAPKDCVSAGAVHVLSPPPDYRLLRTVAVGVCPSAAALAFMPF